MLSLFIKMNSLDFSVLLYFFLLIGLGTKITTGVLFFHVVVVPLLFRFSKTFSRSIIFANFVQWPYFLNFKDPSRCGIEGARNLNIEYYSKVDNCNINIGVWHIASESCYERLKHVFKPGGDKEELNKILDNELATSVKPIILYCHGNANSRGAVHRIRLYSVLQKMDFHTIAFDYRGYGDSTNINPSEPGVVEDSLMVYNWLHNLIQATDNKPRVFVWGHSLGTGISSHLLGNLDHLCREILGRSEPLPLPSGLILEAPFNNLADEVDKFILIKLVKWLPYYDKMCIEPFRTCKDHCFKSDVHLLRVPSLPILILHARDDIIVPISVGVKLYSAIKKSRGDNGAVVKFHPYFSKLCYGHKWICNAEDLPLVMGGFVEAHSK